MLDQSLVVGGGGGASVDEEVAVLEADLGATDLITLEIELVVNDPAGRFLLTPNSLTIG